MSAVGIGVSPIFGGKPWSPLSIPGLMVWLDSSRGVSYASSPTMTDADMELVGTANWTPDTGTTISKTTTNPHAGLQSLHVEKTSGVTFALAKHATAVTVIGNRYIVTGYARGDGVRAPVIRDGTTTILTGAISTDWQLLTVEYTATSTDLWFGSNAGGVAGAYADWDDITVTNRSITAWTPRYTDPTMSGLVLSQSTATLQPWDGVSFLGEDVLASNLITEWSWAHKGLFTSVFPLFMSSLSMSGAFAGTTVKSGSPRQQFSVQPGLSKVQLLSTNNAEVFVYYSDWVAYTKTQKATYTYSQSYSSNVGKVYLNTTEIHSGTWTGAPGTNNSGVGMKFGYLLYSVSAYVSVPELLLYKSYVTPAQVGILHSYLSKKWGY